ncbi:bactofilin family protein [Rhodospira trueperi]|uniref:Protein CcmA, bactofilin family n=1 Tax=Rhodospira trueperi TaxID=69960 RepID=A0A1G7H0C0_9PROT|nr:polymer-forming cytoskeletal protein [Rhodospira trueperi]SDE93872.1 protein CcmA, bactofilin family [Rhodospira trueperi]
MFSKANPKPTPSSTAPAVPAADLRKTERRAGSDAAAERAVPSIISADLTITGDMVSAGEIHIDGRVEGDIKCASLIIGISGAVTGEVSAQTVRMHGSVSGQVIAKSVFLASTARMVGDVTHESLAIEPGAFMEGHCRRMAEMPDLGLPDRNAGSEPFEAPRLAGVVGGDAGSEANGRAPFETDEAARTGTETTKKAKS